MDGWKHVRMRIDGRRGRMDGMDEDAWKDERERLRMNGWKVRMRMMVE